MSKTSKEMAEAAVEMAKTVTRTTMHGIDMKKAYETPAFGELVHFFLSQIVNNNIPKQLND